MKWKTERQKREFHEVDVGLQQLLLFMDAYSQHYFGVELTVTELIRTDAEQDEKYANDDLYQKEKWKSYHQLMLAGDLRYALTFEQWAELLTACERLFTSLRFNCVVHTPDDESWPAHVHVELQIYYEEKYHGRCTTRAYL